MICALKGHESVHGGERLRVRGGDAHLAAAGQVAVLVADGGAACGQGRGAGHLARERLRNAGHVRADGRDPRRVVRVALQELARIAEDAARAAGFAPERTSWKPHLTVSRIQPPRDVTRVIERVPPLDVGMRVGDVALFRSHLGGGPARYEAVERFALG